ncbi:phosphoribosylformylglycinamidine synthase subunit PurQ [Shigella flexneri]
MVVVPEVAHLLSLTVKGALKCAMRRIWRHWKSKGLVALRYVDNFGKVTQTYPSNSERFTETGITAVTHQSGRVTIMMLHPGTSFPYCQQLLHPENWARMAHGCAFSRMHVSSWGKLLTHWYRAAP